MLYIHGSNKRVTNDGIFLELTIGLLKSNKESHLKDEIKIFKLNSNKVYVYDMNIEESYMTSQQFECPLMIDALVPNLFHTWIVIDFS